MSVGSRVTEDHFAEAKQQIEAELRRRLNAAAQVVRNEVVLSLNRTQPKRTVIGRTGKVRVVGLAPSRVGEPPKKLTGKLQHSIIAGVRDTATGMEAVVGSTDEKAARLEFGFQGRDAAGRNVSQGARPYLRPALKKARDRVLRIMRGGV